MEINVTHIMARDLSDYSDSIANSGLQNIGQITWRNACEACEAMSTPLVPYEEQDTLRDWIREFGAWDDAEIAEMTDVETNALLLQFIAGEGQGYIRAEDEGRLGEWLEQEGGRLYRDETGEWYFYVGN